MGSLPYGLQSMLKEGHKHFAGVDEAVLRNIEACKNMAQITRTSLGPNGACMRCVHACTKTAPSHTAQDCMHTDSTGEQSLLLLGVRVLPCSYVHPGRHAPPDRYELDRSIQRARFHPTSRLPPRVFNMDRHEQDGDQPPGAAFRDQRCVHHRHRA